MPKPWIESLAEEVKQIDRDAAKAFLRQQHITEVIEAKGGPFFAKFVECLANDVQDLGSALRGDPTDNPTMVRETDRYQVKIDRERFPLIRATLGYANPTITYSNVRSTETPENETFEFQVNDDDTIWLKRLNEYHPMSYQQPEEFSRFMVELMFRPQLAPPPTRRAGLTPHEERLALRLEAEVKNTVLAATPAEYVRKS